MRSLLVVILLSGCTAYYYNPGNPRANWDRDLYECQMSARAPNVSVYSASGKPSQSAANAALMQSADRMMANADEMYWTQRCLHVKGWRER